MTKDQRFTRTQLKASVRSIEEAKRAAFIRLMRIRQQHAHAVKRLREFERRVA